MSETMDKYIFANDDFEKAKEVLEKHAKIINQVRDRLQRNPLEVTFSNVNVDQGWNAVTAATTSLNGLEWPNIESLTVALSNFRIKFSTLESAWELLSPSEKRIVPHPDQPKLSY